MTQQLILSDGIVIVKSPTLISIGRRERDEEEFCDTFHNHQFFYSDSHGTKSPKSFSLFNK